MAELDADLVVAFSDGGRPTKSQVRRLMEVEAGDLGMTFKEALAAARTGTLPHTPGGIDFRYWVQSLQLGEVVVSGRADGG